MTETELANRSINTIRFLAADAVQKANSGHPGLPMGVAPLAYILWTRHMNFDPQDPNWPNRDRFVLSAGHGSMLLYSMLHLVGYELPMKEIQRFRQWGSMTPGHPEYGEAPGVETTTGPLGQGFANGAGMALAAEHMAATYNRDGFPIIDHNVYAIVSDGDLMEGIASEAASLAGHLKLGRLVYLYDDNRISIDGSTELTFTENRAARFEAYGWHLSFVEDVLKLDEVDRAIVAAKQDPRPSLIVCRTHIGYGMPNKQDTAAAHGEPPGDEELEAAKENLGWPLEPQFLVPEDVGEHFASAADQGREKRRAWLEMMNEYRAANGELAETWDRVQAGHLPQEIEAQLPVFDADGMATRASSGKVLNALAKALPELIGGSADLTGSNKTDIQGEESFSLENREGRYIHFGVREHAMGGMLSGMALYGGLIPYGGTFLIFSDYMKHSIRLAALMRQQVIYVFTHDSIGLGEDGPTHQPIEQLPGLRAIPNLTVIRPGDANETAYAWLAALQRSSSPTALALTRQSVPTLGLASAKSLMRGAYVLADIGEGPPEVILMASGSELSLIVKAGEELAASGNSVRLISFPSWELFQEQSDEYRQEVLPTEIRARVAIEAASPLGWERWVGDGGVVIGLDRFGASAPYEEIYEKLGLTWERVVEEAQQLLARGN
ncbi:MAG: transketolase [Anaerolineales bacterium]